jgi:signal transduction histidine kinase
LFEELLTYVAFDEFDYERPALQTSAIEVISTVQRLVSDVTSTEPAVSVHVQGAENAKIVANPKLFGRAVTNLLLNAVAYGGGKISIYVREFPKECVVDVQDAGPGIPERDRPRVVKPFVRLASKKTPRRGDGRASAVGTARRSSADHARPTSIDGRGLCWARHVAGLEAVSEPERGGRSGRSRG